MADDVTTPSNPPVATVDKDKLEEATLDGTLLDKVTLEARRKTIQKSGAHSSQSFGMGLLIVS
jgi:hypothetical protein